MIDDMRSNYEIFKAKTTDLNDKFRESLEAVDTKTKETAFETKELKHTVDHFGDNLILSSTQITVESTAGFSKRPQSLLDVLKTCQTNMSSADRTLAEHTAKITENTDAIVTKADATVAFAVQTLDKDVLAIKNHLKKEEDQGISVCSPPAIPLICPSPSPPSLPLRPSEEVATT
jgi:UTP:GlnB (protein PII) uridylyltransferase